jgi:hypothetical protein
MATTPVTPNNGNPFDAPLAPAPSAPVKSLGNGNPFDAPLASAPDSTGQVTNDVGNAVIVPKDGESFADTVNRAVALTKQRQAAGTQQQAVDAETATIPAKTAETVAAAPLIGAGGTAALAAPGEIASGAEKFLQISEKALEHLGENYPQLTKLAAKLGYGAGAAGAYKLLNKLGLH